MIKRNIITRDKEWSKKATELYDIQIKIKILKAKEKEYSEELVKASNRSDSKYLGLEFKKISKIGAVKYSTIPALEGIDLDPYRGEPFSYWRLYKKY